MPELKNVLTGLVADPSPDGTADYVMTYDASATELKKVLLKDLPHEPSDGDHGDITVTSGVWTIDDSTITLAKLGTDITTAGKALLADVSAATQRATLGVNIRVEKEWLPSAVTTGTTPTSLWDLPASAAAVATDVTGTNVHKAVLSFTDSGLSSAEITRRLPSDWTGALDITLIWYSSATTGNCKWSVSTGFGNTDGTAVDDVAYNAAQTVVTASPAVANKVTSSTITTLTTTGSAVGGLIHLKISRDGTDVADTLGTAALLIGVEFTYRRSV